MGICIIGMGFYYFEDIIINEELVESLNVYVEQYNLDNVDKIVLGELEVCCGLSVEFIEKVFGVKCCYVVEKIGILDLKCLCLLLYECLNDEFLI